MSRQQTKISPVRIILILFLVVVIICSGFKIIDILFLSQPAEAEASASSKTITVDGVDYYPRQDITVFMLMGIDQFGKVQASNSYNNQGEADVVMLAVFDEAQQDYTVLALNRDTMMDVPVLGIGGKPAGTSYSQLALAHTYGSGLEDSCENTKTAVSNFLSGITIDYYMAMNMDGIAILNDSVGGVKVNVTEDFSEVDPSIPMGETVLTGEQAISFVQVRKDVGNQMNASRMERQEVYMNSFFDTLQKKLKTSDTLAIKTYESMSEYMVTDCSVNTLNTLLTRYSDYSFNEVVSPEGENVKGDTYMEFYADEKALNELIIDLFYAEK